MSTSPLGKFISDLCQRDYVKKPTKNIPGLNLFKAVCKNGDDSIVKYIQTYKSRLENIQNKQFTSIKVTPLMASVAMEKYKTTQCLLENGVDPFIQDAGGNTVHYYLAMKADKMALEILKKLPKNPKPNELGARSKDFLDRRHYPDPTKQVFFYRPSPMGEIQQGDGSTFVELTKESGVEHFLDVAPHLREKDVMKAWIKSMPWKRKKRKDDNDQELVKRYYAFREVQSELVVMEKHPNVGYTISARKAFSPGDVIAEFYGEPFSDEEKKELSDLNEKKSILAEKYSVADFDDDFKDPWLESLRKTHKMIEYGLTPDGTTTQYTMKKSRDLASQINDSFPNAKLQLMDCPIGFSKKSLLVALDYIKPGDAITWCYGWGHVVKIHHVHLEVREVALKGFIQAIKDKFPDVDNPLSKVFLEIFIKPSSQKLSAVEKFKRLSYIEKIEYLFYTPSSVLSLFKEGLINMMEFYSLFSILNDSKWTELSKSNSDEAKQILRFYGSFYHKLAELESKGEETKREFFETHAELFDESSLSFRDYLFNITKIRKN